MHWQIGGRRVFGIFGNYVAYCPVSTQSFAQHPLQGWDVAIDVIVDPDFMFAGVFAVQPAGILLERTAPRNRHREKKGIKPGIVEPLSDEASGGEHDATVLRGGFLEAAERCGLPAASHPARKDDDFCRCGVLENVSNLIQVVLAFGKDKWVGDRLPAPMVPIDRSSIFRKADRRLRH